MLQTTQSISTATAMSAPVSNGEVQILPSTLEIHGLVAQKRRGHMAGVSARIERERSRQVTRFRGLTHDN